MNCPQCQTAVPEGALICESCNFILDTSFLGDGITNEEKDEAPAEPAEGATQIKSAAALDADRTRIKAAPPPPKSPRPRARQPAQEDIPDPAPAPAAPPPLRRQKLDEIAAVPSQTGESLDELVTTYKNLPSLERHAVLGGGLVVLSLALPWSSNLKEDDLIGLVGGGLPMGLLALVVMAVAWFRRHPRLAPFRERLLQVSSAAALVSLLGCIYFVRTAWTYVAEKGNIHGRREIASTWPSLGAYLAILAAGFMTYGAVRAYLDRAKLND